MARGAKLNEGQTHAQYLAGDRHGTKATAKHVRGSASKARAVLDLVRGLPVTRADEVLLRLVATRIDSARIDPPRAGATELPAARGETPPPFLARTLATLRPPDRVGACPNNLRTYTIQCEVAPQRFRQKGPRCLSKIRRFLPEVR